jgi:hypothetical protein
LSLCLMNTYGEVKVKLHAFVTLSLCGDESSAPHFGRFTSRGKSFRYTLDGGLVGPTVGLDTVVNKNLSLLPGTDPARSLVAVLAQVGRFPFWKMGVAKPNQLLL